MMLEVSDVAVVWTTPLSNENWLSFLFYHENRVGENKAYRFNFYLILLLFNGF